MNTRVSFMVLLTTLAAVTTPAAAQPAEVEQHTEAVKIDKPAEDATSLAASLGGTLNQGNTESWQLTTGADFTFVRTPHALTASGRYAQGQSNDPGDDVDRYIDTVRNINTRVRYDYFLTARDALFAANVYRWDTFAGLDHRIQGQLGYLRMFIRQEKHRLWAEAGYDITYDNFDPDPLTREVDNPNFDPDMDTVPDDGVDDNGNVAKLIEELDGTQTVHSARLFLGYDNQINDAVSYLGGAEFLLNVQEPEDLRINVDQALRSSIAGALKIELKVLVQFDNVPVEGKKNTDVQSVVSIIYALI